MGSVTVMCDVGVNNSHDEGSFRETRFTSRLPVTLEDIRNVFAPGKIAVRRVVRLVLIREGSGYACRVERERSAVKPTTILSGRSLVAVE
jgi:hypothetical protein